MRRISSKIDKANRRFDILNSITGLRAGAAIAVVIYHILSAMGFYDAKDSVALGAAGVDIFFVISGFIMMYVSFERFRTPRASWRFLKDRFIRIAPMYYLFTFLTLLILLFAPTLYGELRFSPSQTISSFLFVLSDNNLGHPGMLVGVGWTLAFEAFFYLVFACLLCLPRSFALPVLAIVFGGGFIAGQVWEIDAPWAMVVTNPLTFEFLLGCLLGWAVREKLRMPSRAALALLIVGITGLLGATHFGLLESDWSNARPIVFGIPAAAIVAGAVFIEQNRHLPMPVPVAKVGVSSYSLYLGHQYVIAALVAVLWPHIPKTAPGLGAFFVTVLLACLVFGWLCYRFIEAPITRQLKRGERTRSPKVSAG